MLSFVVMIRKNIIKSLFFWQKKTLEQKKKEQDDLSQLFKPVIGQKVSAGTMQISSVLRK